MTLSPTSASPVGQEAHEQKQALGSGGVRQTTVAFRAMILGHRL